MRKYNALKEACAHFLRILDGELSIQAHVSNTTHTCFFHLRRLRHVRRLLRRDVTANLVTAFVLSRLDYCNALLLPDCRTSPSPLQRVINAAVRLVYGLRPRDHVSAAAIELHWLPIEYRIQYKLVHLSCIIHFKFNTASFHTVYLTHSPEIGV